jgi:hypothetical protein
VSTPSQFPTNPHEFNPYAAPTGTYFQPSAPPPADSPAVTVFAVINLVLAFSALLWAGIIGCVLVYGIFFSGDVGEELAAGVLGSLFVGSPGAIGLVVYSVASLGLFRRRPWGYYFHLAGAALALLTCIGAVYTIVAVIFAVQPEFKNSCLRA